MTSQTQPKFFVSYAHADGETAVKDFVQGLQEYLKSPERQWAKWDDKQIKVGEDWGKTIHEALQQGCNCCLLLLSDLFAKSSYIVEKEWPKTLEHYKQDGIMFFPVVFGVLEGGIASLPGEMADYQVYWPTVADLFTIPPPGTTEPDKTRLCFKDAKDYTAAKDRFLTRLATQMNARFDEYLRAQAAKISPPTSANGTAGIVTQDADEETLAQILFGAFSYERRYQHSPSRDRYFHRRSDDDLCRKLQYRAWVLVEGHPLAGKTRAVFEAIRRLRGEGKTFALWTFNAPVRADQPLAVPGFPEAEFKIAWFDDIDVLFRRLVRMGYTADDVNHFMGQLAAAGVILLATARTGPANYDFRHRFGLDDHIWDKLETLAIPRLEGEVESAFVQWYASFGESLPDRFDHQPGSLFIDLKAMQDRWDRMEETVSEQKMGFEAERARDILRALHVFYLMEAWLPGGLFREEDIRYYLRRKAEKSETSGGLAGAFARAKAKTDSKEADWHKLVEFLALDQDHLGFLRRLEQDGVAWLQTETAYLDHIVAPGADKNVVQAVTELLTLDERKRLGLSVTAYNYGAVFQDKAPRSEKDLEALVRKLKPLGLEREIVVWSQLLHLCPTIGLARKCLEMLKKAGIKPNVVTYNSLLGKVHSVTEGRGILAGMRGDSIKPNVVTYTSLLDKVHSVAEGREILAEMRGDGIVPDGMTYNTLLNKAQSVSEGREILAEMRGDGIVPDGMTYNTLLNKAQSVSEGREILAEMRGDDLKPDVVTYNTLLNKAQSVSEGREILAEMRSDGFKPDVVTYSSLLYKARSVAEGREILAEMRGDGLKPNVVTYSSLLDKAHNVAEGREILVEMRGDGLKPNVVTYSSLLDKARRVTEGREILAEMCRDGLEPNVVTYNSLLDKARSVAEGREILMEMRGDGLELDVVTYNSLLKRIRDLPEALAVLAEMRAANLPPDDYSYTPALKCAHSVAELEILLAEMRRDGVAFDKHHLKVVSQILERDASSAAAQLRARLKNTVGGGLEDYAFLKKLKELAGVQRILLFGSRARGDFKERSDIDLALEVDSDTAWREAEAIAAAADTLLKIDLVRLDTLADSGFRNRILKEGLVLHEREGC